MSEPRSPYRTSQPPTANTDLALLSRAILRTLSFHTGRAHPISRTDLVRAVSIYNASERQIREQIKQLRRAGHLIGSAPGVDGGYYLITSLDEFNDFMTSEYLAKIKDMGETVKAMNTAAQEQFKRLPGQLRLI